jgi:tetratricopeptide (TPR) repeat protein
LAGGDYDGAIEKYRQAIAAKPDDAAVKAKLAKATGAQKADYEKNMAAGDRAEKAGRYREAIQAFTKAVSAQATEEAKQRLDNVRVRRSVRIEDLLKEGESLMEGGNNKAAQAKFEGVLALDPNNDGPTVHKKMKGAKIASQVTPTWRKRFTMRA